VLPCSWRACCTSMRMSQIRNVPHLPISPEKGRQPLPPLNHCRGFYSLADLSVCSLTRMTWLSICNVRLSSIIGDRQTVQSICDNKSRNWFKQPKWSQTTGILGGFRRIPAQKGKSRRQSIHSGAHIPMQHGLALSPGLGFQVPAELLCVSEIDGDS